MGPIDTLKLLNLARKAAGDWRKLMGLMLSENQKATSTSYMPQRKIKYQLLISALIGGGVTAAKMYGYEIPAEIADYATELVTLAILIVGYWTAPKKNEVIN